MYRIVKDQDYATSFRNVKKAKQAAFRYNQNEARNAKSKRRADGVATLKGARVVVYDVSAFSPPNNRIGYLAIDPV